MPLIRLGHANSFNYLEEFYEPLLQLELSPGVHLSLPHPKGSTTRDSTATVLRNNCYLFLAEVSFPSTGLGMEIGYAQLLGIPIACVHKTGTKPSSSLLHATKIIKAYSSPAELQAIVLQLIQSHI